MHTREVHLNFLGFEASEIQKADEASLLHLRLFGKNEATDNGRPYRSISMNFILLDRPFRKEYRYGLIIFPFSTSEKQQAMSGTYQTPIE
jgi:hypothetical protein